MTSATGVAFAYLGCYPQSCPPSGPTAALGSQDYGCKYSFDSATTFGGYNGTFTGSATSSIPAQCAAQCLTKTGANFFGVVNNSTVANTGDCYCGSAVTISVSALLQLTNCDVCYGGLVGQCGKTRSTNAVYGRSF